MGSFSGHFAGVRRRIAAARRDGHAVAAAYGWADLELGHGFHETKQGLRYIIAEAARREVLDRLLRLNHERYAEKVAAGMHEKKGSGVVKKGRKGKQTPNAESSNADAEQERLL